MKYPTFKRAGCFLLAAVLTLLMCPVVGAETEAAATAPSTCPVCNQSLKDLDYAVWNETTSFASAELVEDHHYKLGSDVYMEASLTIAAGACDQRKSL